MIFVNGVHLNAVTHYNDSTYHYRACFFDELVFGIQVKATV